MVLVASQQRSAASSRTAAARTASASPAGALAGAPPARAPPCSAARASARASEPPGAPGCAAAPPAPAGALPSLMPCSPAAVRTCLRASDGQQRASGQRAQARAPDEAVGSRAKARAVGVGASRRGAPAEPLWGASGAPPRCSQGTAPGAPAPAAATSVSAATADCTCRALALPACPPPGPGAAGAASAPSSAPAARATPAPAPPACAQHGARARRRPGRRAHRADPQQQGGVHAARPGVLPGLSGRARPSPIRPAAAARCRRPAQAGGARVGARTRTACSSTASSAARRAPAAPPAAPASRTAAAAVCAPASRAAQRRWRANIILVLGRRAAQIFRLVRAQTVSAGHSWSLVGAHGVSCLHAPLFQPTVPAAHACTRIALRDKAAQHAGRASPAPGRDGRMPACPQARRLAQAAPRRAPRRSRRRRRRRCRRRRRQRRRGAPGRRRGPARAAA